MNKSMISKLLIFFAVISFSFSLAAQSPTTQATSQPSTQPTTQATSQPSDMNKVGKMSFENKFLDIGTVNRGDVRKFEFPFTNTGNAPIKIDLVSSCDCTTTKYPTREILPGESHKILVTFDSTEKEESETIDIDIFLTNEDPVTGAPMLEMLQYKFDLIQ